MIAANTRRLLGDPLAHRQLHTRDEIRAFLEQDPYLHIYELGDLDDFLWPMTAWYGSGDSLDAVVLVYHGMGLPTVVALSADPEPAAALLVSLRDSLPDGFDTHLSPGLAKTLFPDFAVETAATHHKMALRNERRVADVATEGVVRLSDQNADEFSELIDKAYPGNWFDPRMLATGQFHGIRQSGRLVSAGGVHVFSPSYGVAALGNIVTDPAVRNQGLGTRVTAAICKSLLESGVRIGLNVQADNSPAVASYRKLGFEIHAPYVEHRMVRRTRR